MFQLTEVGEESTIYLVTNNTLGNMNKIRIC